MTLDSKDFKHRSCRHVLWSERDSEWTSVTIDENGFIVSRTAATAIEINSLSDLEGLCLDKWRNK